MVKTLLILLIPMFIIGQEIQLQGVLVDDTGAPVPFAYVSLFSAADSTLAKVEAADEAGIFRFAGVADGSYYLEATFVGMDNVYVNNVQIEGNNRKDLGQITFATSAVQLETATVKAKRAIVEVKPDRTVFNVEGTINAVGADGMELLRKAPGVLVDNNENITVLGRSGVLVYVDGRRLPLQGADLTNFLKNLNAAQIDKIDIITNPGARYEAEGNAGIIDIRLKKSLEAGANGSISLDMGKGRRERAGINMTGNARRGIVNVYGGLGLSYNENWNIMDFDNFQNGLLLDESNVFDNLYQGGNLRLGTDFYLNKEHTIGFLFNGNLADLNNDNRNESFISSQATPQMIDSVLIANNSSVGVNNNATINLNYAFRRDETSVNVDFDYGGYRNDFSYDQPNRYFLADRTTPLTANLVKYNTPTDIDIYTAKVDYETGFAGGKLGAGGKFSKVLTDNLFEFFDIQDSLEVFNDRRSNQFTYDEKVYAGYMNYSRPLSQAVNFSGGLRVETTDAVGNLIAFRSELQEDPVNLDYTNFFPSAGLTWQSSPISTWAINYGRRINRPDYNVLNPFRIQLSELSFMRGNTNLSPEIVNNLELGWTYKYMYNFKIAYSKTTDQITRLIGPDEVDPRAGFLSWDNLAEQTILSFNFSAPVQFKSWWNAYFNATALHQDNQADYGPAGIVDLQAFNYNIYQQHTFQAGKGWTLELSSWYSGPGIWGGVFEFDPSYAINAGVQRKFLNDKLNVRLNVTDITFQTGWSGVSNFNGLRGVGAGNWDSRRVNLNLNYSFGNNKYKARNRKTGLESESNRVSSGAASGGNG